MSRTIYFIYDTIADGYVTNSSTTVGKFEDAVICTTLAGVNSGIKNRVRIWRMHATRSIRDDAKTLYTAKELEAIRSHLAAKDCGYVVAFRVIEAPI